MTTDTEMLATPLGGIHHLKLPVTDIARSLAWYESRPAYVKEMEFVELLGDRRRPVAGPTGSRQCRPRRVRTVLADEPNIRRLRSGL